MYRRSSTEYHSQIRRQTILQGIESDTRRLINTCLRCTVRRSTSSLPCFIPQLDERGERQAWTRRSLDYVQYMYKTNLVLSTNTIYSVHALAAKACPWRNLDTSVWLNTQHNKGTLTHIVLRNQVRIVTPPYCMYKYTFWGVRDVSTEGWKSTCTRLHRLRL